ncbi:hypothetical protein HK105_202875 [Polyrhizophydium stewartii]|uniref:Cyclic nucleotide-binding domain-containing protein n=1 Tax=Polyrhizophydium stewartii TaxID=2732419 RepID=A0ABR4NDG9_9FUNG
MYLHAMKFIPPVADQDEIAAILESIKNRKMAAEAQAVTERLVSLIFERDHYGSKKAVDSIELILSAHIKSFARYPYQQRRNFCQLLEGKLIVMEGHHANSFYFVLSGKLEIFKGWNDAKYRLNIISQGEGFGDRTMNVLHDKRTASVTTIDNTELLRIEKQDYIVYAKQASEELTSRIGKISMVRPFDREAAAIEKLLPCMQFQQFEPQQIIFKDDTASHQLLWVLSGSCRCTKRVPFVKKRIQGEAGFHYASWDPSRPLEPGEEVVEELLAITELSVGDSFPSLPNLPMPIDQNTMLPKFDRDHYIRLLKDAKPVVSPVALVANTSMEIMSLSRLEFVQSVDEDSIQYMLEDQNSILNIPIGKLQEAFLQRRQWDTYKKKIRSEYGVISKSGFTASTKRK